MLLCSLTYNRIKVGQTPPGQVALHRRAKDERPLGQIPLFDIELTEQTFKSVSVIL